MLFGLSRHSELNCLKSTKQHSTSSSSLSSQDRSTSRTFQMLLYTCSLLNYAYSKRDKERSLMRDNLNATHILTRYDNLLSNVYCLSQFEELFYAQYIYTDLLNCQGLFSHRQQKHYLFYSLASLIKYNIICHYQCILFSLFFFLLVF